MRYGEMFTSRDWLTNQPHTQLAYLKIAVSQATTLSKVTLVHDQHHRILPQIMNVNIQARRPTAPMPQSGNYDRYRPNLGDFRFRHLRALSRDKSLDFAQPGSLPDLLSCFLDSPVYSTAGF
jgi:hypothetical protein